MRSSQQMERKADGVANLRGVDVGNVLQLGLD